MMAAGVVLFLMLTCPVDQQAQARDLAAVAFGDALPRAERGDADAQEYVALAYQAGLGVAQDESAAIEWYTRAATAGSARSMASLGILFEARRDYARAFNWYSQAARAHDAHAIYRLGIMYQEGWGVPKDRVKALQLVEEAAWRDNSAAQHYLGLLYFQGERVPKSYVRSYAWLNIAAPRGSGYARTRALVEKHLTPDQLGEAQKLSLEWVDKLTADKADRLDRK